jgi:hypothetical protein
MVSHLFFYQLTLIALVWLCVMLQWAWPSDSAAYPTPLAPPPPRPKRHRAPKLFAGLTTKPPCNACEHATDPRPPPQLRPRVSCSRGGAAATSIPRRPSAPTRPVVWSKNSNALFPQSLRSSRHPLLLLHYTLMCTILISNEW